MKKKIIALCLAAACIQLPANAMTTDFLKNSETGMFSISGTAEEARYNQLISIKVENEAKEVVYYSYAQTDNKGNFSYDFALGDSDAGECPTGKYTLYIGAADAEQPEKFEFIYLNSYDRDNTLTDINTWSAQYKSPNGDKETMSQNLVSMIDRMGFAIDAENKYFNGLSLQDKKTAAGYVLEKGTFADINEFLKQFNRCSAIFGLRNANADDVKDIFDNYSEVLHIEQTDTKTLFDNVNKTLVYKRLAGCSINSDSEFIKAFNESVLLAVIESAVSWGDVLNLINTYESNFPFNFGNFRATKEQISKNTASKCYNDMTAFKTAIENIPQGGGITGGTVGGGGGGGSSNTGSVKLLDTVTADNQSNDLTQVFEDIDDAAWAKDAINKLYDKNIIAGVDKTHFVPNENITREAFVKIIVSAFGFTSDDAAKEFDDLPKGHWAYKQIAIANALGIVSGISDTEFGTGRAITREDMMVICCRAADKAGITLNAAAAGNFADKADISDYALQAVERLVSAGFVSGFEDGTVQPKGNTTRAQAAYIICKLMGGI